MTNRANIKAVIPAAGLGSRMLPLTKGVPKEMLPAGRKPMIQHVVEEAVASGVREICVVIREGKEVIRDYFMRPQPRELKRGPEIEELEALAARCELTFVHQREQRGLGDALLAARDFVGRDSSFVMMVPDQLVLADVPATLQLIRHVGPDDAPVIWTSLVRLPKEEVPFFGGARGVELEETGEPGEFSLGRILSDEETSAAYAGRPYEIRGFGRTVYPPEIFEYLGESYTNPRTGEVDLLKTFEGAVARGVGHRGVLLEGEPLDLGTFDRYERYLPRLWGTGV